ncbi:MAG: succinylglutamate desuccinylase/aspartoacylase family protein [Pseudomonadota bacterium]|nr:succinylglutamate desuccinylase/aspartoacylase family protein [Pseudomonadota bacterium]
MSFATPAFEPGRTAFTSNQELASIVHGLERSASIGEHDSDVAVVPLGFSQAGVPIEALAFTRPAPPPALAGAAPAVAGAPLRRPSVVLLAAQHGDEPAGTEALIVLAQELAAGRMGSVLDHVDVVLLPRANPDGAAAFARGAADGTDINRDHFLLQTPEARAIAELYSSFAPLVVLDLHEYPVGGAFTAKFGGVQRFDALLQYATTANLAPFVTKAAEEWFRQPLVASLRSAGFSVDWYATVSADPADRTLSMGSVAPQVGRNASGLRNAVSLLVETRGGGLGRVDLKRRVQSHIVAATSVLASAARHADDLSKLRQFVDRDIAAHACQGQVVVEAAPTPSEYAYAMIDPVSGEIRRLTVAWESALQLRTLKSRPRPCGYWLAPGEGDAVRRLRLLGIEVQQLDELGELRGESYRETGRERVAGDADANAGAATRLKVQTLPALLDVAAGGYYVSLEQPLANVAVAVLEPEAPASFAANGVIADVAGEARILLRPAIRMTALP